MADWLTEPVPLIDDPIHANRSPLRTSTISPVTTCSTGMMTFPALANDCDRGGTSLASSFKALFARAMVRFSNQSPIANMKTTRAAALYSPIRMAAIMATEAMKPAVMSWRMKTALPARRKSGMPPITAEAKIQPAVADFCGAPEMVNEKPGQKQKPR